MRRKFPESKRCCGVFVLVAAFLFKAADLLECGGNFRRNALRQMLVNGRAPNASCDAWSLPGALAAGSGFASGHARPASSDDCSSGLHVPCHRFLGISKMRVVKTGGSLCGFSSLRSVMSVSRHGAALWRVCKGNPRSRKFNRSQLEGSCDRIIAICLHSGKGQRGSEHQALAFRKPRLEICGVIFCAAISTATWQLTQQAVTSMGRWSAERERERERIMSVESVRMRGIIRMSKGQLRQA